MKARIPKPPVSFANLPEQEKERIAKYIDDEVERKFGETKTDYAYLMIQIVLKVCAMVLIEKFKFGTRKIEGKESRMERFLGSVLPMLDGYFDDFADPATGEMYVNEVLDKQLAGRGLTIKIK